MNLAHSTRWCCNRHGEKIDLASFGLGDVWDGELPREWPFIFVTFGSEGEDHERKGGDYKELIEVLTEWRQQMHDSDPLGFIYDIQDIITEDGISLIAKVPPSRLHRGGPAAITKELGETDEWGTRYASRMFEQVWRHDHKDSDELVTEK
jgi:hypothetical protein